MNDSNVEELVGRYIASNGNTPLLVVGRNRRIIHANSFAENRIWGTLVGNPLESVFLDLDNRLDLGELLKGTSTPVLLSANSTNGMPQSWMFSFIPCGDKVAILGEHDFAEIDSIRRGLLDVTNQLSNTMRELYKANSELARLNEMKNEFLGIAAHDLRTPIGNISSLSNMLLDDLGNLLPEEHVELLATIRSLSEFMLTMLENLLDITAIESGKITIQKDRVDLVALMDRAIKLNKMLADRKSIAITLNKCVPVTVTGDAHKLQQVADNLLSNAIKYSERGTSIEVLIAISGHEVTVSVTDHGPGISQEDMTKLFRPFFRARSKTTGGEKSTGLGLAIVQRIVQAHQGRVWVESKPGQGSAFIFSLPLQDNPDGVQS